MNPATGPKSTSFKFSFGGVIAGVGTLISGIIQNPQGITNAQSAVQSSKVWIGGIVTAVSIAAKLIHDHGFNKATIEQAGSEFAQELPQIRLELAKTVGFVENDLPQLRPLIAGADERITALETKVEAATGVTATEIEAIVRKVLGGVATVTPTTTTFTAS